jgi:hypothetical protein
VNGSSAIDFSLRDFIRRRSGPRACLFFAVLALGCSEDPRHRFRYELSVPGAWPRLDAASAPLVPGRVFEAYEVPLPGGPPGSFVVFRSEYVPESDAKELLIATRYLVQGLATTVRIEDARTVIAGAFEGAFLSFVLAGTGREFHPTSLGKSMPKPGKPDLPTRRFWLRLPRGPTLGTLELVLHCPESAATALRPAWDVLVASLEA